jgi:hypothetical protein
LGRSTDRAHAASAMATTVVTARGVGFFNPSAAG